MYSYATAQREISQSENQNKTNEVNPSVNVGENANQNVQTELVEQKGNFTLVPNEMLEFLASRQDLTPTENRLCFFLIRELVGWGYEFKPIDIFTFCDGINGTEKNVITSLRTLVEKGIIVKKKIDGYRTPFYGFNPDMIGRVTVSEPKKVFMDRMNVIDLKTFKLMKVRNRERSHYPIRQVQGYQLQTQNSPKQATSAAFKSPKDIPKIFKEISIREMREFLEKQKPQFKKRWEDMINSVLTQYPEDEALLWTAIELVTRTKQDLFGRAIRRSIIGLFEFEWEIMRTAVQARLNQIEAEAIKKQNTEKNEKLHLAMVNQAPPKLEDTDSPKLEDPYWEEYLRRIRSRT